MSENIYLKPIGSVESDNGRFIIQLDPDYSDGLKALEGFSHLMILWSPHELPEFDNDYLILDKPYTTGPDKIGVFATRSPFRPNPLAVTTIFVMSLDLDNAVIETPFIDAHPGSPILDIKPYLPCTDTVRDIRQPDWCSHLPTCIEDSASFDWSSYFNFED